MFKKLILQFIQFKAVLLRAALNKILKNLTLKYAAARSSIKIKQIK